MGKDKNFKRNISKKKKIEKKKSLTNKILSSLKKNGEECLFLKSTDVNRADNISYIFHMKNLLNLFKDGVGLSASQIGINKNVFIMKDVKTKDVSVFINPEYVKISDEKVLGREGCLSFPGKTKDVLRSKDIEIKYLNSEFEEKVEKFSGLAAVIIQHEMDHLLGKCILAQ